MAAPTNTVTSLNQIGAREDLEDKIYRVAPEETPFTANIGKAKASGIFHEWQTENLATPDETNAQLEGDDIATLDTANPPTRLGNYCQIFRKTGGVSRTQEIVDKAGRASEMNRQKGLKGIELRRDAEKRFIGNFARNVESGATPRRSAGILAFLTSNDSRGAGGTDGTIATAAGNGTLRTFTESLVKTVLVSAFNSGGHPDQAYMGAAHKQQFSAFTGIASIRKEVSGNRMATIIGAADIYVSDFGNLALIAHPYGLTRDCLFVDPDMVAVATLDGVKSRPLSVSGDNDRFIMTMEKCLVVRNEKACAVVADLT